MGGLCFICAALFFQSGLAFRISKKSKGAASAALASDVHDHDEGPMADALRDATSALDAHILAQKSAIADNQMNLKRTKENKAAKEEELAVKSKWYKIQHWEAFTDTLPNIRKDVALLGNHADELHEMLADQKHE